ncbi:hypothetical protein Slin15195_G130440 [Septoria linicola]|uniref:Uncharacterized protein n=1 Tax=Septoria linicola TaxID=215465 RepID=A0A9Q9B7J4_9PEZI|nr:hypothetical protein Slin15195_G130440 [Septoria linicola]
MVTGQKRISSGDPLSIQQRKRAKLVEPADSLTDFRHSEAILSEIAIIRLEPRFNEQRQGPTVSTAGSAAKLPSPTYESSSQLSLLRVLLSLADDQYGDAPVNSANHDPDPDHHVCVTDSSFHEGGESDINTEHDVQEQ